MKKKTIVIIVLIAVLFSALVSGGCSEVTDCSLYREGLSYYWQGRQYVETRGKYHWGKRLANSKEGKYPRLCSIEEDPSNTFVIICYNRDDRDLYVATDYTVPKSGKVTVAYWCDTTITDAEFLNVIEEMKDNLGTQFNPDLGGKNTNRLQTLYLGYDGCPIATEYLAKVGKIDGEWIAMVYPSFENPPVYYRIPEKYISTLEKFKKYM